MSHLFYKPAKSRLHRSELAVPGSNPNMFEKALKSNADYIFLDLEDAVSPNDKIDARRNVINAIKEYNWKEEGNLFVSANAEIKKIMNIGNNGIANHTVC